MISEAKVFYPKEDNQGWEDYFYEIEESNDKWENILLRISQALDEADYLELPIVKRKAGLDNKILAWMNHTFNDIPVSVNADIFDVNQVTIKSYISEASQVMTHPNLSVPKGQVIEWYFKHKLRDMYEEIRIKNQEKFKSLVEEANRFDEFFEGENDNPYPSDGCYAWEEMYRLPLMKFVGECDIHRRGSKSNDICVHEQHEYCWVAFPLKQDVYYSTHLASINIKWNICEKNKRMRITPENDYNPTYTLVLDTMPIKTTQRLPSTVIRFGRVPDGQKAIMLRDIPIIPPTEHYLEDAMKHVFDELFTLQIKQRTNKNRVYAYQRFYGL